MNLNFNFKLLFFVFTQKNLILTVNFFSLTPYKNQVANFFVSTSSLGENFPLLILNKY